MGTLVWFYLPKLDSCSVSQVETQLSEAEELGVRGLLHTLQNTQSVVAWRRVCEVLHNRMLREKGKSEQPNTRQVFQMGFDKLIYLAGKCTHHLKVLRPCAKREVSELVPLS